MNWQYVPFDDADLEWMRVVYQSGDDAASLGQMMDAVTTYMLDRQREGRMEANWEVRVRHGFLGAE